MDKQTQHELTHTVTALRCAATGIATAIDAEQLTGQHIYDLLMTIANQQECLLQSQ